MLQKKALAASALLLGVLAVFAMAGCDAGNNPGNPDDDPFDENPYGDSGTGWPSSSRLSTYGLGGMGQPSGASDITWVDYNDTYYTGYSYPVIYIGFSGTAATDTAVQNWFSGNGWAAEGGSYGGASYFSYTKGEAAAYFGFSEGSGYIVAGYPVDG
ncbi:MAG: hypothetical protein LBQ46_14015 [Treponema sp.]|jgi:hypothetical protein|nr:hypothetical protein [Treponema sp.]